MPSLRTICSGACRRLFVVMINLVFLPDGRGNKTTLITNGPKIWGEANFARRAKRSRNSDAEVLATMLERALIRFNRFAVC